MKKVEENPESYSPYDERPRQANVRPAHIEYQQQRDYMEPQIQRPYESRKPKNKLKIPFIIVSVLMVFFFFLLVSVLSKMSEMELQEKNVTDDFPEVKEEKYVQKETRPAAKDIRTAQSVWASKDTPINKFDYYIDGDEIFIKKYKGSDKRVRIGSSYNIDGKTCYVAGLTDATFLFSRVDSIIIPEGVRSIAHYSFNSCGAKFFFLPSTLTNVDESFWGYFHEVKKIYYGGTREQWDEIFNVDRGELEVEEIIFEAKSEDLK